MSRLLPGPYTTQILADLGADVVKIEDPSTFGDYLRLEAPYLADRQSVLFHFTNRGKRSLALDLRQNEDKENFFKLLAESDVFVESYRPGVLSKITGLSPQEMLVKFPHLVICSITGYGQTGLLSQHAGHDLNFLATSGMLGIMETPVVLPGCIGDLLGGSYPAAIQIISALYRRSATGDKTGCVLDISIAHNLVASYALQTAIAFGIELPKTNFNPHHSILNPEYNRNSGVLANYTVYETKNGHMVLASTEDKFWQNFLEGVNIPKAPMPTVKNPEENAKLYTLIQNHLKTKTTEEWEKQLHEKDLDGKTCFSRVYVPQAITLKDEMDKMHQIATVEIDEKPKPNLKAESKELKAEKITVTLPGTPLSPNLARQCSEPAPQLGQHTIEILNELKYPKLRHRL